MDGSGTAYCFEAGTLRPIWKMPTEGGAFNVNNVSSPAVIAGHVHFGTTAGNYYVLRAADGGVVRKIACGDPIFSSPVIADAKTPTVYFATLGGRVHAVGGDGQTRWSWDFVRQILKFPGDRWSGEAWAAFKKGRVTWREQFCVSREIAAYGNTLVVPAGGTIVWLEDRGDRAVLAAGYAPNESPATLGLSLGPDGTVYRQWYRRDNGGSVEVLRRDGGKVTASVVDGTQTAYNGAGSMSFSGVAIRGGEIFRTRPEEGFGLVRHATGKPAVSLGAFASIAPPALVGDRALVSGLDGALHVVSTGSGPTSEAWSFKTPFGRPITAPAIVADGHVYFGGEDGYLYALRKGASAAVPTVGLKLASIRSPLSSPLADAKYDWFTNFGDLANTNRVDQDLSPPFKMRWIRRVEGTVKHLSVCGGGRSYTHTAEGQIWAVEQETGRLLWRTYFPGVHVSYTAPIYREGRLLVPQAGLRESWLRCLDAASGKLLWAVPFSGSPSWNRQLPPLVHEGRVFYCFSTGKYDEKAWLFEHQNTFGFPAGHRPLVKCWDLATGNEIWTLDFSEHGSGGDDAGLCLLDGMLYYSTYFGNKNPPGVTAAIEPATGKVR
ncbi:MAG: PQQ-binding-like beta-propeller repeat protein, partial [Pirellulales bacterium]